MRYILLFLLVFVVGCSEKSSGNKNSSDKPNPHLNLTHGYSFIYKQLGALVLSEKIFLVRNESDQVQNYGAEVADFAKQFKKDLESMSEKAKTIKLDNTGQSKDEKTMFDSIAKDSAIKYLPVVGLELKVFERKFLLSSAGLLEQIHFMLKAIMELETSEERKKSLQGVCDESLRLRDKGLKILNKNYFKHDQFK